MAPIIAKMPIKKNKQNSKLKTEEAAKPELWNVLNSRAEKSKISSMLMAMTITTKFHLAITKRRRKTDLANSHFILSQIFPRPQIIPAMKMPIKIVVKSSQKFTRKLECNPLLSYISAIGTFTKSFSKLLHIVIPELNDKTFLPLLIPSLCNLGGILISRYLTYCITLTRVTTVRAPLCKGAFKNMSNKELPDSLEG